MNVNNNSFIARVSQSITNFKDAVVAKFSSLRKSEITNTTNSVASSPKQEKSAENRMQTTAKAVTLANNLGPSGSIDQANVESKKSKEARKQLIDKFNKHMGGNKLPETATPKEIKDAYAKESQSLGAKINQANNFSLSGVGDAKYQKENEERLGRVDGTIGKELENQKKELDATFKKFVEDLNL